MFRITSILTTTKILVLSTLMLLTVFACQKDDEPVITVKEFPNVDEKLWPYFERFEKEAARRDVAIDINERGIHAEISEVGEENIAGLCNYHSDNANEVIIDTYFWNNSSELLKELIIFHELGHCYLLRSHRDDAYDDGNCKSLMRSGTTGCNDHYHVATRDQYLTELFDPDSVE